MTGLPAGWHGDPYRRHENRYWDGRVWTGQVRDAGLTGTDPVFPVVAGDASAQSLASRYLASRADPGTATGRRAAAWAIGGFLAVVALAFTSPLIGTSTGRDTTHLTTRVEQAANVTAPALPPSVRRP